MDHVDMTFRHHISDDVLVIRAHQVIHDASPKGAVLVAKVVDTKGLKTCERDEGC